MLLAFAARVAESRFDSQRSSAESVWLTARSSNQVRSTSRSSQPSPVCSAISALQDPKNRMVNKAVIIEGESYQQAFRQLSTVTKIPVADFEAALPQIPQIIEAQRLFGDPDYLLQVIAKDLQAFQQLYDERLTSLPNVQRLVSTLVMKSVIHDRVLPLS